MISSVGMSMSNIIYSVYKLNMIIQPVIKFATNKQVKLHIAQ